MRAYAFRCWPCSKRNPRSKKWPPSTTSVMSSNVPRFSSSTRPYATCTCAGNRISVLKFPRLASSNSRAPISSCSSQMRLTCFGRYEHSQPHCPSRIWPRTDAICRVLGRHGLVKMHLGGNTRTSSTTDALLKCRPSVSTRPKSINGDVRLEPSAHSEYEWLPCETCLERVHFRGLKDGLRSVHECITGVADPARELCLYVRPSG